MFLITHGKHKGQTTKTEDAAIALLSPEDLAQGGYVHYGSKAYLEGGEWQPPTINPIYPSTGAIDGSSTVALMGNIHRAFL